MNIDDLIQKAKTRKYGPHYQCECKNNLRHGTVQKFCPKCGVAAAMVSGDVYIRLHVSATWEHVDVQIEDFREWINKPNAPDEGRGIPRTLDPIVGTDGGDA